MIREMKLEDLLEVKNLMQSTDHSWHKSWTDETLERAFKFSQGESLVYVEEDKIVGCIFAFDFGFRGYISGLVVHEEMRHRGIASLLVKNVEERFRKRNCELIIADIVPTADKFYDKLQWRKPWAELRCKTLR